MIKQVYKIMIISAYMPKENDIVFLLNTPKSLRSMIWWISLWHLYLEIIAYIFENSSVRRTLVKNKFGITGNGHTLIA